MENFNNFSYYSKVAEYETNTKSLNEEAIQLISKVENCKTIRQIKTLLKDEFNITTDVLNSKISTFAFITTMNREKCFEVTIEYSNKIHKYFFPKIMKEVSDANN